MAPLTPQQLRTLQQALPEDIARAYTSTDTVTLLEEIGRGQGLSADAIEELVGETSLVLLGYTHPRDYIRKLSSQLNIELSQAKLLANEVNQQLFQTVRGSLRTLHKIEDAAPTAQAPAPVPTPEPPSTPPQPAAVPESPTPSVQPTPPKTPSTAPESPLIIPQQNSPAGAFDHPRRTVDTPDPEPVPSDEPPQTEPTPTPSASDQPQPTAAPRLTQEKKESFAAAFKKRQTTGLAEEQTTPASQPEKPPLQQHEIAQKLAQEIGQGTSVAPASGPEVETGEILKKRLSETFHVPTRQTHYNPIDGSKPPQEPPQEAPAPAKNENGYAVDPYREVID